jgi:hypothetical protein
MKTTDTSRAMRLMNSAEFGRYRLKDTFSSCASVAPKLEGFQTGKDSQGEALTWIQLAQILNDDADLRHYAERASVDVEKTSMIFMRAIRKAVLISTAWVLNDN